MELLFVEILFDVFLNGTRSESIVAFGIRRAREIIILQNFLDRCKNIIIYYIY